MPALPLCALALALSSPAAALSLDLQSESAPWPGVTLREYRASDPDTDVFVALVDLCAERIHVQATKSDAAGVSTGSWASEVGVQVATNGDFYTSGPQVYGDAIGNGIRWPADHVGLDRSGEWYDEHYGWIAFLHDQVTFTHTGWVKENLDVTGGWAPTDLEPDPPPGTLALVSGFPELITEGARVTCSSPTASDCFPDRSDMRARHPRTAMGITEDHQTFILAVVDGRTTNDEGMYGAELALLMEELGAWQAYNLDGGGSSQLWAQDESYVNDASGNNYGSGYRSVANHWGIFAGEDGGRPLRPGHCEASAPCELLPSEGGVLDDEGACFQAFGDLDYWRDEDDGYGGRLLWTNAWETDVPDNWAWWQVHLSEAGTYAVEAWIDPDWVVYDDVRYVILADGVEHGLRVDPTSTDGWLSLGSYAFAAGGGQHVAVWDDSDGDIASGQKLVADAVRLTCLSGDCAETDPVDTGTGDGGSGDGGSNDGGSSDGGSSDGGSSDGGAGDGGAGDGGAGDGGTASTDSGAPGEPPGSRSPLDPAGCGCGPSPGGGPPVVGALLALALSAARRARPRTGISRR